METVPLLTPTTLWSAAQRATAHGLACGALQPIATEFTVLEAEGIPFLVRILANLARKADALKFSQATGSQGPKPPNPFLPYEPDLWVGHFSATHTCLLNKYNVVDHHLLIITRHYESQETWLTEADFAALAIALGGVDGLGFYNGGRAAGASQHHKHLQLVPFPLGPQNAPLPLEPIVAAAQHTVAPGQMFSLGMPFQAMGVALALDWEQPGAAIARGRSKTIAPCLYAPSLYRCYRQLMAAIGQELTAPTPTLPYNLLVTRQWMVAVPRCQEEYQGIPVNALGYAGSLLVKDVAGLHRLQALTPLTLLTTVGRPATAFRD